MTNSGKQNSRGKQAKPVSSSEAASGVGERDAVAQFVADHLWTLLGVGWLVIGWVGIFIFNEFRFNIPVFFLCLGWVGVLATMRFLTAVGAAAAVEWSGGELAEDGAEKSDHRRRELMSEKLSLLKAIKEIEFDRDLGKMSEQDATQIMRFYRARAIEVIKEIDGLSDESLSVDERIERDMAARAEIAKKTKAKSKSKASKTAAKKDKPEAKADASDVKLSEEEEAPLPQESDEGESKSEART